MESIVMDPIKNILIPVELSPISTPNLMLAKKFAQKTHATLHILSVVDPAGIHAVSHLYDEEKLRRELVNNTKYDLDRLIQYVGLGSPNLDVSISVGVPFIEILYRSLEVSADLIIMGSQRETGFFRRFLLGNTAYKIIRRVPCTTLSVKARSETEIPIHIPFKKILVAFDFSEHAKKALDFGLFFHSIFPSELHVVHIQPHTDINESEQEEENVPLVMRLSAMLDEESWKAISSITSEVAENAAVGILKKARDLGVDLIAIGSHSKKSMIQNMFLGKIAYDVVRHAECSVLTVKLPD
jgi:nucleotide-binding universal stress UspA family protein